MEQRFERIDDRIDNTIMAFNNLTKNLQLSFDHVNESISELVSRMNCLNHEVETLKEKNRHCELQIEHSQNLIFELTNCLDPKNDETEVGDYCGTKYKKMSDVKFIIKNCVFCKNILEDICIDCENVHVDRKNIKCLVVLLKCTHAYHLHCFQRWYGPRTVCPMCNNNTHPHEWVITGKN